MKILTTVVLATLMLGGCARKNDTPDAVKQGVVRDLAGKFDMTKMDVDVDAVSFQGDQANATVTFIPKGGTASQGMSMRYAMERHSDGQWYIKSRASGTGAPGAPAASGAMPAGHPAMSTPMDMTNMPGMSPPDKSMSGAESASGSKLNLPPGHPELGQ